MEDPIHYAMVKSINDVAQTLGKQTIAESVESEDVLEKLLELVVTLKKLKHKLWSMIFLPIAGYGFICFRHGRVSMYSAEYFFKTQLVFHCSDKLC